MSAIERRFDVIAIHGHRNSQISVKASQEEATKQMFKGIGDDRGEGNTVVEEFPAAVKGSNGLVERTVQENEGHVGALLM
eukprot:462085-Karenia_brevis.AAC.1